MIVDYIDVVKNSKKYQVKNMLYGLLSCKNDKRKVEYIINNSIKDH